MASWSQLGFQDAFCNNIQIIILFHDHCLFVLTIILFVISYIICYIFFSRLTLRYIYEGVIVETIWTCVPSIILVCLCLPRLQILYMVDEVLDSWITVKVIGRQWYWDYEYLNLDGKSINYSSYIKRENILELGEPRILSVGSPLVLPFLKLVRVLVTSGDVIHRFSVPSLGLKIDAIPGKLRSGLCEFFGPGKFHGICSELCGVIHANIPISIEVLSLNDFLKWLED